MPGDYVKQLQLAKQLEQKAREAARGRETAEGKIEEASALLLKVKEMNASSAETEKLLTLAHQSYSDKDYKEALSYAVKSVEASARARKERLLDMLREARSILERVADLGKAEPETERALKKASDSIDSGDLDEAYGLSKDAWDTAERNANRVLSDAFGLAQSSLLFAERLDLKVEKQKVALRNCRDALESGDVGKSVELIQALSGTLRSMTLDRFVQRAAKLETLLSLEKGLPLQLQDAHAKMAKGRELISHGKVEDAFGAMDDAEDIFSRAFGKVAGQRISDLKKRAESLSRWKKVDLGDLEGDARRLELDEKYQDAVVLLDSARRKVRDAEKEVLLRYIAALQPRLKLAHLTKKDVTPALQKMEEARKALQGDDLNRAFALTEEAGSIVEERLQGYDQVEKELQNLQGLRSRCADLGLGCSEGSKLLAAAKKMAMHGEYANAVETLRSSQRSYRLTLENHFATGIMRLEMRLASAMRLGADVTEESTALENLTDKVRKGDFELVHGSLITIGEAVEQRTSDAVSEEIGKADIIISRYASSPDVDRARASLAEAKDKFDRKEFPAAHEIVSVMLGELMSQRRESLDRSLRDGRTMLDMAKQLGAESVTLRDRLQRAEELRSSGRMDEATMLADEVVSYGKSIVTSEIDQQLTDIMQRSANARKEGVEVGAAEHMSEQASSALHHGELGQAFELTMNARSSLNEVVATHQSLKERLEEGETMMSEARRGNANVAEASEALVHAGMLLRSGRYKDSQDALDRAEGYLRRQAPEFLLSYSLKRMADLGKLREKLGYLDSEERLTKLGSLDPSDLESSLSSLGQLRQEWEGEITASLDIELNKCQKDLDRAVASGFTVGHVQQILTRGRSALEERKMAEAMRAVELVKSELDQTLQNDRRLTDALAHLEESLDQLKEMKAEVKDVTVLLEQARALRRTGNVTAAADAAQRALERSQNIARERVTSLMSFAGGLTTERSAWEDLRTARKLGEDIEEALKNYRYRHAHLLARSFREELERVLQDKAQADEELRKFETRLREEAKAGLSAPALQKALDKAKSLMIQGRFVQALSTVGAARDELRSVSEMYESRLTDYNDMREALNSLEVLDPRKDHVEELLDQSWTSLKEMRFESASLYLRRAKNGLNEFLTVRTNELLWEFNPLHDLIKRLKIQKRFSAEISEIEKAVVDQITPRDLNRLARNVELIKAGMRDIFQEQKEKVRRTIEKSSRSGKEAGRSWEVWADAETQAKKGDLWEAFNSLETALNFLGRKAGETPDQLSKQLSETLERANRQRIELPGTQKVYADALQAQKEGKNPLELLRKAIEMSRKEVRSTYPDISAELELVGEAKEGRAMDVVVHLKNEAEHEARNVRAFIFGDAEVKGMVEAEVLKPNQEVKGRITVIPNRVGILSLGISVKCKPLLTDEDVLYDSKFDLDVK
ncbi:MAG: hypothetical protein AB9860_03650 [Methanomassiliicoccales archaeon]